MVGGGGGGVGGGSWGWAIKRHKRHKQEPRDFRIWYQSSVHWTVEVSKHCQRTRKWELRPPVAANIPRIYSPSLHPLMCRRTERSCVSTSGFLLMSFNKSRWTTAGKRLCPDGVIWTQRFQVIDLEGTVNTVMGGAKELTPPTTATIQSECSLCLAGFLCN